MNFDFWNKLNFKKQEEEEKKITSETVVEEPDGAVIIEGGYGSYGTAFSNWGMQASKDDAEQIRKYRNLLLIPEVDYAVDDICNEAISTDTTQKTVKLILDDVDVSDKLKEKLNEEFDYILKLMRFDTRGYEYFKDYYVDGRIAFHKIIDSKRPKQGLLGVRQFDSVALKKYREVKRDADGHVKDYNEGYIYDESLITQTQKQLRYNGQAISLPANSVAFVHTGEFDSTTGLIMGPLHYAIKYANNLSMMEDSTVVYRYSRAPEKRVFYVDTGNLPPAKAEAHVARIMNRYKNKVVYDPVSGGVKDQKNLLMMYEDFWLPRSASGKTTQVDTLEGAKNMNEIDDILYHRRKLYQALHIPLSRIENEGVIQFGKIAEITRDELKFNKFVGRHKKKFSEIFNELLGTHVILKNVLSEQEWLNIKEDIRYDFVEDAYLTQQKGFELLQSKVEVMRDLNDYVGKHISNDWVLKNVWNMSEDEIKEQREKILEEKKDEIYGSSNEEETF